MQHERNTDNIRIVEAFRQNNRSFDDIADEVRNGYSKRGTDEIGKYLCKVAIVEAYSLQVLYIIHED